MVKVSKDKVFNVVFRAKPLDRVDIVEMVVMDERYKEAYKALPALQQNKFYSDLKISLLESLYSILIQPKNDSYAKTPIQAK
jgi:hypothetical protein